ncbi:MAG: NUDIX domain-containing protein [Treponema sp.]|jgi:8-oxo-dGTP diphosphatase|nr:NUDIX domain-containing protein [Treponema sp.]
MKKSVAGIVCVDGLFFIARRIPSGVMGCHWEFPGGKVEKGDSFQDTLIREYKEEFGISVKVGDFIGKTSFKHNGKIVMLHAYEVIFPKEKYELVLTDHTEVKWIPLEEIETLLFVDSDLLLLPYISEWNNRKKENQSKI